MSEDRHWAYETTIDGRIPIYLYEVRYGETEGAVYRYTDSLLDQILFGSVWRSTVIRQGEIALSGNLDRSTLEITAVEDISCSDLFLKGSPSKPVVLTISRGHAFLTGDGEEASFVQVWSGRILSVKWEPENGTIIFGAEPSGTSVRRLTLRRFYQYGCGHVLYGPMCKLSAELHTGRGIVREIVSPTEFTMNIITPPHGMDDGTNMNGGRIKALLPDGREIIRSLVSTRYESANDKFRMKLLAPAPELFVDLEFEMQRGCQHTWEACQTFNNLPNFGGCPNIPVKNPFATSME